MAETDEPLQTKLIAVAAFAAFATVPSLACMYSSSDPFSEEGIRRRFEQAESVVLATVIDARGVRVQTQGNGYEMPAEMATFRVDRVFKGPARPGQVLVFYSASSCAASVVHDSPDVIVIGKRPPFNPSRQWLLYRTSGEINKTFDMTRPLEIAGNDLLLLPKLAKEESRKSALTKLDQ